MSRPIVIETYDPWAIGLKVAGTTGGEYIVTCPFHGDAHASACFNPIEGLFFCFACGATAKVEKLARVLGGHVAKTTGGLKHHVPELDWKPLLASALAIDHPYLAKRGVTNKQVKRWGIRALPTGIAVPITNTNGTEVGIIVRRHEGTPRYLYFGQKPPLWPLNWLMDQEPGSTVYVVEGIFGRFRAERAGVPAVAVLGATVQEEVAKYLRSFDCRVIFDNDFAGYCGAGRILTMVPTARVIVPGREADEMQVDDWRTIGETVITTRSITTLAKLSGDPGKFYHRLPNTQQRWKTL